MQNETIQLFMAAMAAYSEAVAEEKEARGKFEGYSWDYYGAHYIDAVKKAETALYERLTALIDERIETALDKTKGSC